MIVTGCAAPTADTSACAKVPEKSLQAIGERLDVPGTLRFGQQVPSSRQGMTFVSAELHEPDHDEDEKGDIYTWAATSEDDSADYVAVDTRAKSDSSWPAATFDVREDGAIESRACTNEFRDRDPESDRECPAGTPPALCDRASR
jgi:hypothetical protein